MSLERQGGIVQGALTHSCKVRIHRQRSGGGTAQEWDQMRPTPALLWISFSGALEGRAQASCCPQTAPAVPWRGLSFQCAYRGRVGP